MVQMLWCIYIAVERLNALRFLILPIVNNVLEHVVTIGRPTPLSTSDRIDRSNLTAMMYDVLDKAFKLYIVTLKFVAVRFRINYRFLQNTFYQFE